MIKHVLSMGSDKSYMKKCIELAKKGRGLVSPNPLVGCVIVKNGKIIAEGYHHTFGKKHAEIDALDKIAGKAKNATLYVNLEPCCIYGKTPPCTDRIIKEGIKRVVIGNLDPNPSISGKGVLILQNSGIEVETNVLKKECRTLNQFFFKWITTGIPYVTLKIARTSDNFIAYPNGNCPNISCDKSRKEVHKLRSFYDAVLIGKNTALKDNPKLTVRKVKGRQPTRIVLDTNKELLNNQRLNLFNDEYSKKTLIVSGKDSLKKKLEKLGQQGISSILVEGGPTIWDSFMKENLVDQIIVYTANKYFGSGIAYSKFFKIEDIKEIFQKRYTLEEDKVIRKYLNIY